MYITIYYFNNSLSLKIIIDIDIDIRNFQSTILLIPTIKSIEHFCGINTLRLATIHFYRNLELKIFFTLMIISMRKLRI